MLQLSIIALFLRSIPEGILLIFGNYVITDKRVNKKRLLLSGTLLGVSAYIIRLLPIHFGVHTILFLMAYIFLAVKVNKMDVYKAVRASIACVIAMFVLDWLNLIIYLKVFNLSYDRLFNRPYMNVLSGIPSLIIGVVLAGLVQYVKSHRKRKVKYDVLH